ncbi:hypothetical protein [Sphingomonas montana]|uniref:hypothetical protein n=1 Tax=Sphingomonas montana TaxID=1843236 RepID=UPI00096F97D7|nr:hypothetical protein [Sphingomonas montana]
MTNSNSLRRWTAAAFAGVSVLALDGCATRGVPVAALPAPVPVAALPRPVLPAGIPERLAVPIRDAAGTYRTINYALTPDQVAWHVRSALNVAVLSCRGPDEAVITADYNALLKRQKLVLAAAYERVQAQFRRTGGAGWQSAQDAHSTRVYNFFALPPAKPGFCAAATALLTESRSVEPATFASFAEAALPRLEAPFTDVYRSYDGYRRELAAWEARQPGVTMQAQALPTPAPAPQAAVATKVAAPAAAAARTASPRLEYVGLDTLMDWQPVAVRRNEQLAAIH